ncbi:D-amino acid dehydrogenase [Nereida sp. MMG025]|uniref:D-amino acid dehydrogenase n=1 Tax=Nereida sp. MMG025 TaxID=2909981 RepID=UPI001F027C92|nr:D-amino acid dehydrogenase [Nereida sp. MMG025]MCF6444415.1 D-amino acid dehydrogenase [Nereida sp. MMG025]
MKRIAVIGAGITGVTTAFELHQRGFEVVVYDRNRYAAMETSFANGGQLSASNAEVWNTVATVLKGIKWMARHDAPLLVNPRPSWHKLSWMAEFLANIPKYQSNTIATAALAVQSRKGMTEMAQIAGLNFDWSPAGILHFYKKQKDLDHARNVTELLRQGGVDRRELSVDEVRQKAPTLRGDLVGGFWTESDSTGDIHKFTFELAQWLSAQGVQFQMGQEISQLHSKNGVTTVNGARFDGAVVCAGVGSRSLARKLGDRVNIYPVKGYSITVNMADSVSLSGAPQVSLLDDDAKIVTSRLGKGRFRVAGTAEFNGYNRDIRADRIAPLTKWVETHFPDVSTENVTPWAGLRPMMPNMMPKVGAGRAEGVFYNTGHGHLGWTLSAATAGLVATQVQSHFQNSKPRTSGGFSFKTA